MSSYPDYKTYRALYARYYKKRPATDLLDLVQPVGGHSLLDLCGGDGRLTIAALASGAAEVTLVDAEQKMIPAKLKSHRRVNVVIGDVSSVLSDFVNSGTSFDRAICQQAVNYWLDKRSATIVAKTLSPGGVFAFNTFNRRPAKKPRVLKYRLGKHDFVEVSWMNADTVHHLQVRTGLEPHYTAFRWLSPSQLSDFLSPHFKVQVVRQGKTSLYRCSKK